MMEHRLIELPYANDALVANVSAECLLEALQKSPAQMRRIFPDIRKLEVCEAESRLELTRSSISE